MKLATLRQNRREEAAIVLARGVLPIAALNTQLKAAWPEDLFSLIASGELAKLNDWFRSGGRAKCETLGGAILDPASVKFGPLTGTREKSGASG